MHNTRATGNFSWFIAEERIGIYPYFAGGRGVVELTKLGGSTFYSGRSTRVLHDC